MHIEPFNARPGEPGGGSATQSRDTLPEKAFCKGGTMRRPWRSDRSIELFPFVGACLTCSVMDLPLHCIQSQRRAAQPGSDHVNHPGLLTICLHLQADGHAPPFLGRLAMGVVHGVHQLRSRRNPNLVIEVLDAERCCAGTWPV